MSTYSVIRNVQPVIVVAFDEAAVCNVRNAEAEERRTIRSALHRVHKRSFREEQLSILNVGDDGDWVISLKH